MREISLKLLAISYGIHCNPARASYLCHKRTTLKPLALYGGSPRAEQEFLSPAGERDVAPEGTETVPDFGAETYREAPPPWRRGLPSDLPDRLVTLDRVGETLAGAHRAHHDVVLLLIGIDDFATGSGRLRRSDADALGLQLEDRLLGAAVGAGSVARVSAHSYAVMVAGIAASSAARRCANRVLNVLSRPFYLGNAAVHVNAAIGASTFPRDATRPDELLRRAEQALSAARRAGPNAFRSVQTRTRSGTDAQTLLRAGLRAAVARNELELHYQAKFDLADGRITGAEALLRWRHPELGLVEPARFIPLAEADGCIVPIGEWVLRAACEQVRRWRDRGLEMQVGVNVSARQFREPDLAQRILDILHAHRVEPSWIELELTESAVMDDADGVAAALERLKASGVRLAIDDFGTGYASLSYLTRLPVHVVKIDQSFVRGLANRSDNGAIVLAIVRLARNLGMDVIAEGVETGRDLAALRAWGCDRAQGYFFGKPVGAEEFATRFGI